MPITIRIASPRIVSITPSRSAMRRILMHSGTPAAIANQTADQIDNAATISRGGGVPAVKILCSEMHEDLAPIADREMPLNRRRGEAGIGRIDKNTRSSEHLAKHRLVWSNYRNARELRLQQWQAEPLFVRCADQGVDTIEDAADRSAALIAAQCYARRGQELAPVVSPAAPADNVERGAPISPLAQSCNNARCGPQILARLD